MIGREDIIAAAEEALTRMDDLFLVEVKASGADEFHVFVDSDGVSEEGRTRRVTVDDCVRLTRAIESQFDRDEPENDFSLTVSSAGIGQPLRVARQYRKLVGRAVEVVLASGAKLVGTLEAVEVGKADLPAAITLTYKEKQKAEGEKRPKMVEVTKRFEPTEVKSVAEYIDFK